MSPANGTYIYGKTRFTVNATDNVGVSKTELYYSLDPEAPYESWNMLISHNGSTFSENVDTTVMPSDVVYIVAKIYDAAGNYTYSTKRKYMCDNIGPEKVQNVQCVNVSGTTATLSWSDVSDEDISYFIVESKNSDGTWSTAARSNTKLGVNLSRLTPETTYTYRVIGYDLHGNRGIASDEITVKTEKDTICNNIFTLKLYDYSFNNLDGDVLIGDIDLDGVITIKDVTLLQKYLADVSDLSDKALIAADVDKDGTIDICDATKIRSYLCDFADKNIGYCGQRSR